MALQDKKQELESQKERITASEQAARFEQEKVPEKQETPDDKIVSAELRKEIEMMELDPNTKKDAEAKAEKIEFLGEKEKIERLLEIARERGVVFAVQVAKKTNDPYLLDILHDILAQKGYYKDFTK